MSPVAKQKKKKLKSNTEQEDLSADLSTLNYQQENIKTYDAGDESEQDLFFHIYNDNALRDSDCPPHHNFVVLKYLKDKIVSK